MPRQTQPPRLKIREARYSADGKLTHKAQWRIHDGPARIDTKCGIEDTAGAEAFLADYLVGKHASAPIANDRGPEAVLIGDLIAYYLKRNAKKHELLNKDNHRDLIARFHRLIDFWGGRYVIEIDEDSCDDYQTHVTELADSTHRKHLEALRAVIRFGNLKRKVMLGGLEIDYNMPPKQNARVTWYTRKKIADLCRVAYRRKRADGVKTSVHLVRFILVGVYTGTRSDRIQRASFYKEPGRPWLDLDNKIFYRSWEGETVADNKRADAVRIPDGLLSHLKRWKANGARYLIEVEGEPTGTCRSAFRRLVRQVLGEVEAVGYHRHTLRHTCATWLIEADEDIEDIARYLSCTPEMITKVYGHHHPNWMKNTAAAFGVQREKRVAEIQKQKRAYEAEMKARADELEDA